MIMGNRAPLKWVELAPSEQMFEVAHYKLMKVAFHKLIEVSHIQLVFHSQQKRIHVSCFQETVGAVWHSFVLLRVKMTFS